MTITERITNCQACGSSNRVRLVSWIETVPPNYSEAEREAWLCERCDDEMC